MSAWVINMLVRDSPDEVDQLLELGAAFQQAQDDLDGAELRELTRQRQTLIGAVVDHAKGIADDLGRSVSDAIATEIEQTLRAGMADPDAAAAVRGGALTTAIAASGLGSLNISDVAASTTPVLELVRGKAAKKGGAKKSSKAAEESAEDKEERLERARAAEALEQAEQEASAAADRLTAAGEALERGSGAAHRAAG